jgi:gamma-glutamyltranspeptidase/glutathione hydrolase
MDDFATAPGVPNAFGLVQGEANAIRPGKRMLSSMTPLLAWRDGEALALGGRGGSHIPTGAAQVFLNLVADGDDMQAAVERPRIHHQWQPDELVAEPDALSPETRTALERHGHRVVNWAEAGPMSSFQAVRWSRGGTVAAAADPRRRGVAGVVEADP